jgi:hypothetical protein
MKFSYDLRKHAERKDGGFSFLVEMQNHRSTYVVDACMLMHVIEVLPQPLLACYCESTGFEDLIGLF